MPQASQEDISSLIGQLQHKSSPKRRAAAKKLRKLKANKAGPALLSTLKNELKDKRTWETQYQMIMALGESRYTECLDFLVQLTKQDFEATMLYVAIGDAVTTMETMSTPSVFSLIKWIEDDKKELVDGSLRSLATHHIVPSNGDIQKIIQYVSLPKNQDIQFWAVAAAPGWPKELIETFLKKTIDSDILEDTKKAAKAALNGKYLKWNPL